MTQLSMEHITSLLPPPLRYWCDDAIDRCITPDNDSPIADQLMVYFSKTPRAIKSHSAEYATAQPNDYLTELCRLYLLLRLAQQPSIDFLSVLKTVMKYCDDDEKICIAHGLTLLDPNGLLLNEIIDWCRTNSTELFSAIALDNEYPAKHFPEINFNQLVLKSLFSGLDIGRVNDLAQRKNSELSRMASDYRQERINANREVPTSLILAL